MPTLQSSFPSGYEPSADDYQAMLDILNALNGMPVPTVSNATGTTVTTPEAMDTVLGTYQFTVPANGALWRYEAVFQGWRLSGTAGELWGVHIRDGGASTPTNTSTLCASYDMDVAGTGGAGQISGRCSGTWVPGAGVHTLGTFLVRNSGTNGGIIIAADGISRELFAKFSNGS